MIHATEPREAAGIAEQRAQQELTDRVGVRLVRRSRSRNLRWRTWTWRFGLGRGTKAET
jgi:hypothetical protein